jgi:hypothetical protein
MGSERGLTMYIFPNSSFLKLPIFSLLADEVLKKKIEGSFQII